MKSVKLLGVSIRIFQLGDLFLLRTVTVTNEINNKYTEALGP